MTNGAKALESNGEAAEPPKRSVNPPIITPELYAMTSAMSPATSTAEPTRAEPTESASKASAITKASAISKQATEPLQSSQKGDSIDSLTKEFENLYRKIEDNRRVQDAAASARQDAILRLVSSTLTDNVEKSLQTIVNASVQQSILPSVERTVSAMVEKRLTDSLATQLSTLVPQEIKSSLPGVVTRALQDKEFHRNISEQMASKVTPQIQQTLEAITRNTLVPSLSNIAATTTQKTIADIEARFSKQMQQAEVQRRQDNAKMEQMSGLIYTMSETMQTMSASQVALTEQVEKLQRQFEAGGQSSTTRSQVPGPNEVVASVEDEEVQMITDLLTHGRYEEGTIKVRCTEQFMMRRDTNLSDAVASILPPRRAL